MVQGRARDGIADILHVPLHLAHDALDHADVNALGAEIFDLRHKSGIRLLLRRGQ